MLLACSFESFIVRSIQWEQDMTLRIDQSGFKNQSNYLISHRSNSKTNLATAKTSRVDQKMFWLYHLSVPRFVLPDNIFIN